MRVSIMQPYFFPYIGYLQLLQSSDIFVVYDDVAFINKGWINRNRILANGAASMFTIPLKNASQNRLINEIEIDWNGKWETKFLKTLEQNHKKSPHFQVGFELISNLLQPKHQQLSELILESLKLFKNIFELNAEIIPSSIVFENNELKAQDRILDIVKKVGGNTYINAIGGKELYLKEDFEKQGVELKFLETQIEAYPQNAPTSISHLSILDLLMNVSIADIKTQLNNYQLID